MRYFPPLLLLALLMPTCAVAQVYNQIDETGNVTQRDEQENNRNFNPHSTDSTSKGKEIPRGLYVWTVDRKFGDIRPAEVDTMPHLFMNQTFNTGVHGEYNTTGSNYTARENRIFIDRPERWQFMFNEPYSYIYRAPEEWHFTNTLSPITNLWYDNCGDKQNGEDHIDARFSVNVNKRLGIGFDLNYAYARGYFSNQNTSHFGSTLYASYLGDKYNMHALFTIYHQKASENGGITDDEYIRHPESFNDSYTENEIPTVLKSNWNRNHSQGLFLTHRYNLGFYREEQMTQQEIEARKFAKAAKADNDKTKKKKDQADDDKYASTGRPDNAKIAGDKPQENTAADSTRIKIGSRESLDSLLAIEKERAALDSTLKKVFVPVTSFIHTLDLNNYTRSYIGYATPSNYYAQTYYSGGYDNTTGDSIYDRNRLLQVKNTLALALREGFNKYAKAGLKAFMTHELRRFEMPDIQDDETPFQHSYTEHTVSIGGQLSKQQGHTWHYGVTAETWIAGEDAGQMKLDANTDLNFALFGDTVQLAAKAYFYRLHPTFFQRNYHSKNIWWDNDDLAKETRSRIEGTLSYQKTKTKLRVAIEEIQNYSYFGMSYNYDTNGRQYMMATMNQHSGNINVMTAQLTQDLKLGPLHWDNIITYQNSSNSDVLPLPALNAFSNLYLSFKIAKVLSVELGADATIFTKYYAPDFCPQLNQFAVQQNEESRVELGGFPFVDVYANMHLKRARFFIMMNNVTNGSGNRMAFLTPHYPVNGSVLHIGVSWNFFN